jgi:Flp pilus assembly protein TadD
MKNIPLLLFIFCFQLLHAQQINSNQGSIYAVVVGISDYQDVDISDLKFAHKDALAFADFLNSPAGGALDDDHLKVLINEQATQAQFGAALDWLWEMAGKNDKAIIYFSGHGDVEKKSLTQPGFLLCWDAPSKVYMGGGAFPLSMLQEVISTISVQNKAKVIMIADACRAGKLSGSKVGGAQLTNANLAKQYSNEIKILSCQPDEFSIEGKQWGGGRGAFSFHLLEGLYGLADRNSDLSINLLEIRSYLEEKVLTEVDPHSQIPMTIGNGKERLTFVIPELLEQIKSDKNTQMPIFASAESKGIEEDVLEETDSNIVQIYLNFKKALTDRQFLFAEEGRPENDYADYYYQTLIKEPQLKKLHSSMRRNYAAALQDDAQQTMNSWMKSSQHLVKREKKKRLLKKEFTKRIMTFPACLERAAQLLGKSHYMYATLQARKHFFEGFLLANTNIEYNEEVGNKALVEFRRALQWEPELPQTYWQMAHVFAYKLNQLDSAEVYGQKAIDLHPSWAKPYQDLAFIYSRNKQLERAKPYLDQAMLLDSTDSFVWGTQSVYYARKKEYDLAEKYFIKALQLDSLNSNRYASLALFYDMTNRLNEAEKYYKKAVQIDSTYVRAWIGLAYHYKDRRQYDEAQKYFKKALQLDSTLMDAHNNLGILYKLDRRYYEAEIQYKKIIQLDSTFGPAWVNLGDLYLVSNQPKKAKAAFLKTLQLENNPPFPHLWAYKGLGQLAIDKEQFEEAEKHFKKALELSPRFWEAYNYLGIVYTRIGRFEEAKSMLDKSLELEPSRWWTHNLIGLLYIKTGQLKEAKASLDKSFELSPNNEYTFQILARWSLKMNQIEQAWEYLEKALEEGYDKYEFLQSESDFEVIRNKEKWTELMKKYFPDQFKK